MRRVKVLVSPKQRRTPRFLAELRLVHQRTRRSRFHRWSPLTEAPHAVSTFAGHERLQNRHYRQGYRHSIRRPGR
jgi:hypothetical protein